MLRSLSDPSFVRAPLHAHHNFSRHDLPARFSHTHPHLAKLPRASVGYDPGVWSSILHPHMPKSPVRAISSPHGVVDVQVSLNVEKNAPWSVVFVELIVTTVFISFGVISFWFGTWTILDLSLKALFGPDRPQFALLFSLGFGLSVLVLSVVLGKLFLGNVVYKRLKPRTWGEVFRRTLADRLIQYVQAWGGIAIWKAVWDIWTYFILIEVPWGSAAVAHVVGLVLLLVLFAFRSAVTPPMVFVEDTIMLDTTVSRWNLLSKFLKERQRRKGMSNEELEWEDMQLPLSM